MLGLTRTPTPLAGADARPQAVVARRSPSSPPATPRRFPEVQPRAAGVLVPGLVDDERGIGVFASNLGWRDAPFASSPSAASACRSRSATTCAPPAKPNSGSAPRAALRDVVVLVIGTGIAGALFIDGRPHLGGGYAGEIGHSLVDPDGPSVPLRRVGAASRRSPRPAPSCGATRSAPASRSTAPARCSLRAAGRRSRRQCRVGRGASTPSPSASPSSSRSSRPRSSCSAAGSPRPATRSSSRSRARLDARAQLPPPARASSRAQIGEDAGLLGAALRARDLAARRPSTDAERMILTVTPNPALDLTW